MNAGQWPSRPRDHRRHKFRNEHFGIGRQARKRCPERKSHAQPADQNAGAGSFADALGGKDRQFLFGPARAGCSSIRSCRP